MSLTTLPKHAPAPPYRSRHLLQPSVVRERPGLKDSWPNASLGTVLIFRTVLPGARWGCWRAPRKQQHRGGPSVSNSARASFSTNAARDLFPTTRCVFKNEGSDRAARQTHSLDCRRRWCDCGAIRLTGGFSRDFPVSNHSDRASASLSSDFSAAAVTVAGAAAAAVASLAAGLATPLPAAAATTAAAAATMGGISPNFTPLPSFLGGLLIGAASSILLLTSGRIMGASGIINGALLQATDRKWRLCFLAGMVAAGVAHTGMASIVNTAPITDAATAAILAPPPLSPTPSSALQILLPVVSGLLVGFGTQLGSGCTSGHGVCGLPRFSRRSFVAVGTFMATGFVASTLTGALSNFGAVIACGGGWYQWGPHQRIAAAALLLLVATVRTFVAHKSPLQEPQRAPGKPPLDAIQERKGKAFEGNTPSNLASMESKPEDSGHMSIRQSVAQNGGPEAQTSVEVAPVTATRISSEALDRLRKKKILGLASSVVAGAVFGSGLALSSMLDRAKVRAFLDPIHGWDPSLAFVMGGAILLNLVTFPLILKRSQPTFDATFQLPARQDITFDLIAGSGLFGLGWGLFGLCPGPAIVSLVRGQAGVIIWFLSLLTGMLLFKIRTLNSRNHARRI